MKRKTISIRIHPNLIRQAKEEGINLSGLMEEALKVALDMKRHDFEEPRQRAVFDKNFNREEESGDKIEKFKDKLEDRRREKKIEKMRDIIRENAYEPNFAWEEVKKEGLDEVDYVFTEDFETFESWCKRLEQTDGNIGY